ncbi:MAG: peptide-methionine (R)-S-oxide reductase MsrB [Acidobacteria bacterium]|nr:peptide-methionine (R)-S-oxide reductase MsrB [Acidobacteriota bacterium]
MASRRQFLTFAAVAAALAPVLAWLGRPEPVTEAASAGGAAPKRFPLEKPDAEWRAALTSEQYYVLRGHGTEPPFTSPLNHEKRRGTFVCAGCGQPLFSSETKYESGTGWPSFWTPLDNAVGTSIDRSWLMVRTEVHCARCGGHLGHIFPDGPQPTGLRYCINGDAMKFTPGGA